MPQLFIMTVLIWYVHVTVCMSVPSCEEQLAYSLLCCGNQTFLLICSYGRCVCMCVCVCVCVCMCTLTSACLQKGSCRHLSSFFSCIVQQHRFSSLVLCKSAPARWKVELQGIYFPYKFLEQMTNKNMTINLSFFVSVVWWLFTPE